MVAMQQVLLNDFKRQWAEISRDALDAVDRVGSSGWYVLGGEVRAFESALAAYWGMSDSIGVASGLDAIEIALRATGLEAGDAVLTTPLSAFATTLAIVRCGGRPVFCDTDADGLLDLAAAEEVLRGNPQIRYMVPVHLFGQSLNLDRLAGLQERYGVTIIEDCAQSVGASWNGRATGTVGAAAATSFYPTKNLGAMGDGGAVLTNQATLAERARRLRDYGQSAKYRHDEMGWNSRLDELHAAILRDAVLPRLAAWTAARQEVARQYEEGIKHPQARLVKPVAGSQGCGHLFPVWVEPGRREHFEAWLKAGGIGSGRHYPLLIPDQKAMMGVPHDIHGALNQARRLADGEVSLPIHPQLTPSEIERVIAQVNAWVPGA
jgi:dTDP-4-amino-4,6-dideoxygalactose transaminase